MNSRGTCSGGLLSLACLVALAFPAYAADVPPPPAAAPPVAAAAPVLPPGVRIGAAEVPIVGGNLASAREHGIADALKQAVDQAVTALAPEARAKQPKVVAQTLGRARSFVRRYQTLEEGEVGRARYAVKLEVEIDEAALRRTLEAGPGLAAASAPATSSYLLVGTGPDDAVDAVARALVASGAKVERAAREIRETARAVEAAARLGLGTVAFVNAGATPEGQVRGLGVEAVSCSFSLRLLATSSGSAVGDESRAMRGFSERGAGEARKECLARAAGALVHAVAPAAGVRGGSDFHTIVLDADVVEPGAVPALLKQLRGSGNVSSVEIRRILPGRIEVWVRSRLTGSGLAALLGRDGGAVVLSGVEASGDLVRVRARLPEVVPIPAVPVLPGVPVLPVVPGAPSEAPAGKPTSP